MQVLLTAVVLVVLLSLIIVVPYSAVCARYDVQLSCAVN